MNTLSPIISAAEASVALSRPNVVVVDARGGADARQRYDKAHVANAIFFDLEKDLSKKGDPSSGGRHPLPDPSAFGRLLEDAGITPDHHLLVYDDKAGANAAARFWWMMKSLGHENIQVIDGGVDALEKAGVAITQHSKSAKHTRGSSYPAHQWLLPMADIELVDRARLQPDWLVIDVREGFQATSLVLLTYPT
jgi:thiosulfate/3-mercaptopyruvate sulfurtransferase